MIGHFDGALAGVFRRKPEAGESARYTEEEILQALEYAVDGTDARIRLVGGYRKRLRDPVEVALAYLEDLVQRIPGVIDVNRQSFVNDPRVHAFFASVDELEDAFSRSPEVRAFLGEPGHGELAEFCALMCMRKTERSVLGMALEGDIVRREVPQVTVSFSEHQINSPACDEVDARLGLQNCLFHSLVTNALGRISLCQASTRALDLERSSLYVKLRTLEKRLDDNGLSAEQRVEHEQQIEDAQRRLEENEAAHRTGRCSGPEDWLQWLHEVLAQPEKHVQLHNLSMRLSQMGVKLDGDRSAGGDEIELAEVELAADNRRVVVLARFPCSEMRPLRDPLEEASRYLAI